MVRWFVMVVAMSALLMPVYADPPMTKLRIEVKTLSGRPVERASVIVRFVQGRSIIKLGKNIRKHWELRTNQDGVAHVPSIPQGKVLVQVIAKGYQTFGQQFEVADEEKTLDIKLNPPQSQYSSHQ